MIIIIDNDIKFEILVHVNQEVFNVLFTYVTNGIITQTQRRGTQHQCVVDLVRYEQNISIILLFNINVLLGFLNTHYILIIVSLCLGDTNMG